MVPPTVFDIPVCRARMRIDRLDMLPAILLISAADRRKTWRRVSHDGAPTFGSRQPALLGTCHFPISIYFPAQENGL
jgi:hypothetical protein